jgi:uncharacterized protein (UPF0333 family)
MHIKNKRGQSTVEYVLLMTAVVVVIIAFVSNTGNGGFRAQLNATLNSATADMNTMAGTLADSHAATTAPTGTSAGIPPYSVNVESGV